MTSVWERLREIADRAEADSKRALSDEAQRRVAEYRDAQLDDPLDLLVRVPRLTTWQYDALRFIASGETDDCRNDGWINFIRRTKPAHEAATSDPEINALRDFCKGSDTNPLGLQLNLLGLAALADFEDQN